MYHDVVTGKLISGKRPKLLLNREQVIWIRLNVQLGDSKLGMNGLARKFDRNSSVISDVVNHRGAYKYETPESLGHEYEHQSVHERAIVRTE